MSNPMITLLKSINWQDPSKFKVTFSGSGASYGKLNSQGVDKTSMAISNIQLAEINTTPIEEYTAEEWRFALGRAENLQITINFKDFNNFTLYRLWTNALQDFMREYPDTIKFNVDIFVANIPDINNFTPIVSFKDCILVSVSAPTLDHSAIASIAEFSITAKCSYVKVF